MLRYSFPFFLVQKDFDGLNREKDNIQARNPFSDHGTENGYHKTENNAQNKVRADVGNACIEQQDSDACGRNAMQQIDLQYIFCNVMHHLAAFLFLFCQTANDVHGSRDTEQCKQCDQSDGNWMEYGTICKQQQKQKGKNQRAAPIQTDFPIGKNLSNHTSDHIAEKEIYRQGESWDEIQEPF